MVEYATDIEILRPADRRKANGILFFNVVNRGNKGGIVSVQRRRARATASATTTR